MIPPPRNSPDFRVKLNAQGKPVARMETLPRLGGSEERQGQEGDKGEQGNQGPQGEQGVPGPQGPPGSKYAIVPGLEHPVGLYCSESPQAWFFDILRGESNVPLLIDPEFIEVCEPGSLKVIAVVCEECMSFGAKIKHGHVVVTGSETCGVNVTIAGLRKGSTARFPQFSIQQMYKNQNHWDAAIQ